MLQRPEIIVELCRGYEYSQSAMPCGTILRQALQYDTIAALILYDESQPGGKAVQLKDVDVSQKQTGKGLFWQFFTWINKGTFEVSADAFTTFRVCPLHSRVHDDDEATDALILGNSHKAQTTCITIPRHQLRPLLHLTL